MRVGAGRKKTGINPRKKKTLQISALPEHVELIKQEAKAKEKTVSDFVLSIVLGEILGDEQNEED